VTVRQFTATPPAPDAVRCDVVVLVPVYRNAATLAPLAARVAAAMAPTGLAHRLLFVVDASPDDAWRVVETLAAQDARVSGLLLARNLGQHRALLAGMAQVDARWVAVMDADLQDPPEVLPGLIEVCAASGFTVFARRQGAYQSAGRMLTSRVFKTVLGGLLRMPADVGTFLVMPRQVCDRLRKAPIQHPQVVVMARAFSPGWRGVPYVREHRAVGSSAYSGLARLRAAGRSLRCAWQCWRVLNTNAQPVARPVAVDVAARVNL
jgi:glycosyltransferase involved in cell wall biosynthesis